MVNILRLAAYKQDGRALRRGCEPIFAPFARKDGFGVRVPKRPTVLPSVKSVITGISPVAKILRLAAYERARRALRRGCEPIFTRFARKDGFGVRVPKRPTAKPSVFLAPATGIEPITTP